jgi:hypothetical protein
MPSRKAAAASAHKGIHAAPVRDRIDRERSRAAVQLRDGGHPALPAVRARDYRDGPKGRAETAVRLAGPECFAIGGLSNPERVIAAVYQVTGFPSSSGTIHTGCLARLSDLAKK